MTPDELRRRQDGITARATAVTLAVLRSAITGPVSPRQLTQLVAVLFPTVQTARASSAQLASVFYESLAGHPTPEVRMPHYEPEALRQALERTTRGPRSDDRAEEQINRLMVAQAGSAVARHVEMAGRETVLQAVEEDDECRGWARVASGRETCAFCLLLVSRGAVYKDEQTAGRGPNERFIGEGQFKFHDRCDCIAVPVFDVKNWPGKAEFLVASRLYRESTKGAKSNKDKINAFRRAVERPEKKQQPAAA